MADFTGSFWSVFISLVTIASIVVLINKRPGLGVDLRGGTILVYEIDPEKNTADGDGVKIKSEDLIEPLTRRINPAGTREIVLRPYGETEIECIVPEVNQREVDQLKAILPKPVFCVSRFWRIALTMHVKSN